MTDPLEDLLRTVRPAGEAAALARLLTNLSAGADRAAAVRAAFAPLDPPPGLLDRLAAVTVARPPADPLAEPMEGELSEVELDFVSAGTAQPPADRAK